MAKYCTKCGKEIDQDAIVCPHCGCSVNQSNSNDSNSKGWWCLGFFTSLFFTPVIGLILWLVWKDSEPMKARQVGLGTLWSFLPAAIVVVITVIIYVCLIAGTFGAAYGEVGSMIIESIKASLPIL